MIGLTFMQRTTPTAGLEVILNLMPLKLHVLSTACSTAFRIRKQNQKWWDGIGEGHLRGHLHGLEGTLEKVGLKDIPSDKYIGRQWHKCYHVDPNSMNDDPNLGKLHKMLYGQQSDPGMCRMGYLVQDGAVEHQGSGGLGEWSSVFQAEITAIKRVAQLLTYQKSTKIVFFVDSQAALLALDNTEIYSYLVQECAQSPGELGKHSEVILHWVKAHVGHELNEEANAFAKEGACVEVMEPPPIPKATVRNLIESFFHNRWSRWLQQLNSCCQTKIWTSTPGIMGKEVNLLGCATLSTVIQALMGNNYLNYYHCSKVDKFPTEVAVFCGEEHKEFVHLERECPALARECLASMHNLQLSTPPNLTSLVRFMKVDRIAKAMAQRADEDEHRGKGAPQVAQSLAEFSHVCHLGVGEKAH